MLHQKNLQLNFAQHHAVSVQLNLSTTAILGTDKSGHCREVETGVNVHVWTVYQTKMAVLERWPLVAVRL